MHNCTGLLLEHFFAKDPKYFRSSIKNFQRFWRPVIPLFLI